MYWAESSLLLKISNIAWNKIFQNDFARLAELRMKMFGFDVDLQQVINHPTTYNMFLRHLCSEHASESLLFYRAVERYEEMCTRLEKQMHFHDQEFQRTEHGTLKMSFCSDVSTSNNDETHKNSLYKLKEASLFKTSEIDSFFDKSEVSITNANPVEAEVGPDTQSDGNRVVKTHKSIMDRKFEKLVGTLSELQLVARRIMEKYVYVDSDFQINISARNRLKTEKLYAKWASTVISKEFKSDDPKFFFLEGGYLWNSAINDSGFDLSLNPVQSKLSPSNPSRRHSEFVKEDPKISKLEFSVIFSDAKNEIYKLLEKDSYFRFRHTDEFRTFLTGLGHVDRNSTRCINRSLDTVLDAPIQTNIKSKIEFRTNNYTKESYSNLRTLFNY